MYWTVKEFTNSMELGGMDPGAIQRVREIAEKQGADLIEASDEQVLDFTQKIMRGKDKETVKRTFIEKCKNFRADTRQILTLMVIVMVASAILGIAFTFGSSLVSSIKSDEPTAEPEPMAQA